MTTTTDAIDHPAPAIPERPQGPCPLCGERVELTEQLGAGLTLHRPCGCVV